MTKTQLRIVLWTVVMVGFSAGMVGCATNRGELDIIVSVPENPANGRELRVVSITDARVFERKPSDPSTPSLKNGEIDNGEITSRAIARKRNGYGMAMGDILLPEGRTVSAVTSEILTRSFRDSGYRVSTDAGASGAGAVPVHAEIQKFWAWFTPGMWAITLEFEMTVKLTGDIEPLRSGRVIAIREERSGIAAGTEAWRHIFSVGVETFVQEMNSQLEP